jgi:hypothetical protein
MVQAWMPFRSSSSRDHKNIVNTRKEEDREADDVIAAIETLEFLK